MDAEENFGQTYNQFDMTPEIREVDRKRLPNISYDRVPSINTCERHLIF